MTYRRLQVFISSTITDLAEAREELDRSLTALDIFDVIRSETLPAMEDPSRRVCLDEVKASDAVALLIGRTYGCVPTEANAEALSVTHLEMRQARAAGVPLFAFPERLAPGTQREAGAERLLKEIEDFDKGVFRKTWATPQELAAEVRRSLLFWLARRLRARESVPVDETIIRRVVHDVTTVPVVVRSHIDGRDWPDWVLTELSRIGAEAQRHALPSIAVVETSGEASHIVIDVDTADGDRAHFAAHVEVPKEAAARDSTPRVRVLVRRNADGQRTLSSMLLGLMRWVTEDRAGAEQTLSDAAHSGRLSKQTRAGLLAVAMWMANGEGRVVTLGERLLALNWLDEHAYLLAARALMLVQSGENVVAGEPDSHLLRRATALAIHLSAIALESRVAGTEAIYSVAKQIGHGDQDGALRLLLQVRALEPDYDRRWYWHRDVGQLYYEKGRMGRAAGYYDRACGLKNENGQLWRWAGDAYYYQGQWAAALERYEAALRQDPYELYFLKEKLDFCRHAIHTRRGSRIPVRERLASSLASVAARILDRAPRSKLGRLLAEAAARLDPLERESRAALALSANRQGRYDVAIRWLKQTLACAPERAMARLNLCANLIFQAGGRWCPEAAWQAQAAVALRGVSSGLKLSVLLTNTATRDELLAEFEATIVPAAKGDWDAHLELRKKVLAPEMYGTVVHVEAPDRLPPA